MSTWQRIREARTDLTDYVVHLTRFVVDLDTGKKDVARGFVRLKRILKSGVVLPSFAPRETRHGNRNRTVKGPHKAVCFTGQPLEQIPVTLREATAYEGYGVAVHKVDLFKYGGRPAIYGDESVLNSLDNDVKYLWVRYRPIRPGDDDYPNDFTFEREWRSRAINKDYWPWEHDLDGLPILLPDDFRKVARLSASERWIYRKNRAPDFRIVVRWDIDVKELRNFIGDLEANRTTSAYHRIYLTALKKAQIISLEHVERRLEKGDDHYRRIEDLPPPDERLNIAPRHPKKKEWRILKRKATKP